MSNFVEHSSSLARSTSVPILICSDELGENFVERQTDARVTRFDVLRRGVYAAIRRSTLRFR